MATSCSVDNLFGKALVIPVQAGMTKLSFIEASEMFCGTFLSTTRR